MTFVTLLPPTRTTPRILSDFFEKLLLCYHQGSQCMKNFLLGLIATVAFLFAIWGILSLLVWGEWVSASLNPATGHLFLLTEWLYGLAVGLTVILVIWENGKPSRTLAWILVLIFLPVLGMIAYLMVGGNLRKEKLFSLKEAEDLRRIEKWLDLFVEEWIQNPPDFPEEKARLISLLTNNSKAILTGENEARVLQNGKATFDGIFAAIRQAKHHIHLQFYIVEDGVLLRELLDVLEKKIEEGVEVRFLFDSVGSWKLTRRLIREINNLGIEMVSFFPARFPRFGNRVNYRNHRKIAVIDGTIGFVGGLNLSDRYVDGVEELGPWRDTHLELKGEAVMGLQLVFLLDWFFATGQDISAQGMFPSSEIEKQTPVQIVASGPDSAHPGILQAYFLSITSSQEYIYITNAYLIPDGSILMALKTAALSGIDVRIIVPGKSDSWIAHFSTQSYLAELMEAGVKIYQYQEGFVHSKVFVSDGYLSSIGTANWDQRSFDQNFEVNAFLYSKEIAEQLTADFHRDLEHSLELNLERFNNRPSWQRLLAALSRILSPLL